MWLQDLQMSNIKNILAIWLLWKNVTGFIFHFKKCDFYYTILYNMYIDN